MFIEMDTNEGKTLHYKVELCITATPLIWPPTTLFWPEQKLSLRYHGIYDSVTIIDSIVFSN